jgi:hypothetical protein
VIEEISQKKTDTDTTKKGGKKTDKNKTRKEAENEKENPLALLALLVDCIK